MGVPLTHPGIFREFRPSYASQSSFKSSITS
jgi:hypothetical protein